MISIIKVKIKIFGVFVLCSVLTGCASVSVQDDSSEFYAKQFNVPPSGWAGLYLYRPCDFFGMSLKKNLYVDGQYIGETSRCRFFYRLVKPGMHTLQTESEFSENDISLNFIEGKNKYVVQYIKPGLFVGGAFLKEQDEEEAKKEIINCKLAANQDDPEMNLKLFKNELGQGSIPAQKNYGEARTLDK